MSNLIFLAVAVVIILIGFTVMWVRERSASRSDSSIDRFEAEMGALAPARVVGGERSTRRRRSVRS